MKIWCRGPSICIIVTVCSAARKISWIQLFISKAEIRGLWWSKLHTRGFLLSSMMSAPTIDPPYYCLQAYTVVQHHYKLYYCSLTAHQVKKQHSPLTSASGMIWTPDCPASSQSLYRLSYPAHNLRDVTDCVASTQAILTCFHTVDIADGLSIM